VSEEIDQLFGEARENRVMSMKAGTVPHWFKRARKLALAEWRRRLDFQRDDVYLKNPAAGRRVEKFIERVVWPAARTALEPTRFKLFGDGRRCDQHRAPDEVGSLVKLCIADPDCLNGKASWYTRLEVECISNRASLLTDFLCIDIPLRTDFGLVVDTLSETSDRDTPASLSIQQDHLGNRIFHVVFEHSASPGKGAYGHLPITEKLAKKLIAHCDFIEIAIDIEQHPNDVLLFRRLIHQVNEVFEI